MQMLLGILNIAFSVLLGRVWGLFGILFATTISRLMTSTWYDPYAIFKHGFHKSPFIYLKRYLYFLFILIIAAMFCQCSFRLIDESLTLVFRVLLEIIICSVVVNIVFYTAFRKTPEFEKMKEVIKNVKSILCHGKLTI